ncbi:MAG TPA: transcriptional regulator [Petrimonas sp.]|nr:transcriptional regulator [Petrimonas sp.]
MSKLKEIIDTWEKLRHKQFEDVYAVTDIQLQDVLRLLNCDIYFEILKQSVPVDLEGYAHYLLEEGIIVKLDNGLYAITNLGAILFARRLADFPRVGRKAIRIVQYEGINKLTILKEDTLKEGYAIRFENAVKFVNTLLPSKEDITSVRRDTISPFPIPAIREAIANSLIHQDFFISGTGPVIEIFSNRIEVSNPGSPLIDIMRIVDNPPKSRNEKLASLMRRLKMCEELGRGWDRIVISCELQKIPAPRIQIYQESTKVSLFSHIDFSNISMDDKEWPTYLHACIKFIEGEALTNSSLRERFGLKETSSGSVSRLIKQVVNYKLIKPLDPDTALRHMKYISIWS